MDVPQIVENSGHLYEAGFMLGVIAALLETNAQIPLRDYYQANCTQYPAGETVERFVHTIPTEVSAEAGRVLAVQCLSSGRISGYHFMQEFLAATVQGWYFTSVTPDDQEVADWSIPYLQCSVGAAKQLRPGDTREEEKPERQQWLSQVAGGNKQVTEGDMAPGGFLRADLILYLRDQRNQTGHLLVVDTTTSTVGSHFAATDITIGRELLHQLERDYYYQAEKGVFSRLAIETGETLGSLLTPRMDRYLNAFAGSDRASYKLLQATSYAASFRNFALRTGLFESQVPVAYQLVGYANQGKNSLHLRPNETTVLDTCASIYRKSKMRAQDDEAFQLEQTREEVFEMLIDNTAKLFRDEATFKQAFRHDLPNREYASFSETLSGTFATPDAPLASAVASRYGLTLTDMAVASPQDPSSLRAAHATLTWRALEDPERWLVYLTGYPGIGKTTTIARYLMRHFVEQQQGFMLLYASPRKTVNRDIFAKFHGDDSNHFFSSRFLGLITSMSLIQDAQARNAPVVEYLGDAANLPLQQFDIRYLDSANAEDLRRAPRRVAGSPRYKHQAEDRQQDVGTTAAGVIRSIAAATGAAFSRHEANALVAAFSIQAFKKTEGNQDTLRHLFPLLFRQAYNKQTNRLAAETMKELAQSTPHFIVMIDEIAGDDSGYEFYRRLVELIQRYRLEQYGFQPKVVVADASITGIEVVRHHLALYDSGPDARKIYLTMKSGSLLERDTDPVSAYPLDVSAPGSHDGVIVNGNAFPASDLHIHYQLRAPVFSIPEHLTAKEQQALIQQWSVLKEVDNALVGEIGAFLELDDPTKGQLIVYVQNKDRIGAIIQQVQRYQQRLGQEFRPRIEYLTIHARRSERDSRVLEDEVQREQIPVFFMTSSGSRGLTFKRVKRFLIDVPTFAIETNIMEILQLIYRGRGRGNDTGRKDITFFLSGRILLHRPSDREWAIREGIMDLLTMVALLKLCIMTRIEGAATLDDQHIAAIPIGGKSVSGAARAFHHEIINLDKALRHELQGPGVAKTSVAHLLHVVEELLGETTITVQPHTQGRTSYLALYQQLVESSDSRAAILKWLTSIEPMQEAFVLGNVLIVPMDGGETQYTHRMPLNRTIALATSEATWTALREMGANAFHFTQETNDGIKTLDAIVHELAEAESSQTWEKRERTRHAYYAVPLAIFTAPGAIAAYCQDVQVNDPVAGQALRQILASYLRESYPVDTLLPLGWKYKSFPYVVFTSNDLRGLRAKWFRDGYTIMSRELNLLTMLLSYK